MSAILLFAMRSLDTPLRTRTAPGGIVSFELAKNYAASQQILDSWSAKAKINAALSLGLDFLFLILYGLVLVAEQSFLGLIVSLILSAGSIFAFCIHTVFIRKGRHEFNTPVSRSILTLMLGVSTIQAAVTIYILVG
jgi:hypothetical protein